jgi:aldose 1-epimerase
MKTAILVFAGAIACAAAQYSVERKGDVIQLSDSAARTVVSVLPPAGNIAFEMNVKGVNVLRFPYASAEEFRKKPGMVGIPFLAPWANRLDEQAFYANGKKYLFNMELGNVRGKIPMHGFLTTTSDWRVVEAKANRRAAWVTSRLDFTRQPSWMAQWPFAHAIEMTYRLQEGILEVQTRIENLSAEPMPVAIGFHPFFRLTDSPRDEWTISVGARTQWLLSPENLPTGETRPIETFFPDPRQIALRDYNLDHLFGDLVRDPEGRAVMAVKGKSQKLDIVLVAPAGSAGRGTAGRGAPDRNFICFEPMAGITNALNLAQKGVYKELQSIAPGATWQASFWVRPSGF